MSKCARSGATRFKMRLRNKLTCQLDMVELVQGRFNGAGSDYDHLTLFADTLSHVTFDRFFRNRRLWVLALVVLWNAKQTYAAYSAVKRPDIWVVSTRDLERPSHQSGWRKSPKVWKYDHKRSVSKSSLDSIFASQRSDTQTCIFVHGNRMTINDAHGQALCFLDHLNCEDPRVQYIIFSWPSEKIVGLARDARVKADRADGDTLYLAQLLSHFSADSDVVLIGYSFGARLCTGSVHLLAGGMFGTNCLPPAAVPRVRPRMILLASAFPRKWLLPGHAHGLTLSQTDHLTSFYNRLDPALRHYSLAFHQQGRPQALGYECCASIGFESDDCLVEQIDVTNDVGRSHSLSRFVDSSAIMSEIRLRTYAP